MRRMRGPPPRWAAGFISYSGAEARRLPVGRVAWLERAIARLGDAHRRPAVVAVERGLRRRVEPEAGDLHVGVGRAVGVDRDPVALARQAVLQAHCFEASGVTYFEEPVSSDQLVDMAFVREHASMDIAAGEYGYDPWYFRHMLESQAVDILQADATRCLGFTGFLQSGNLAQAFATLFSAHTAPSLHAHVACAVPQISHVEFFYDHARIERLLLDGFIEPENGCLRPDTSRPGLGFDFKRKDAERWQVWP